MPKMFRKNDRHLQQVLISNVNDMREKHRKRLENSWAGVFYQETFCRLSERPFAVLYADIPSRPNIPINVLVGLESLKADFGWSDEELYDNFTYNMQVRYALGYHQLGEGDFDLRSLYYFRERVSRYMQEKGINLIEKAFEQITDEQTKAYKLKTGKQRMDSTQIASNIREMSRLQLLVEVMQRVQRMLTKEDQKRYEEAFAAYTLGHAGQYVYHLKGQDTGEHLQKIGELMERLLVELQPVYVQEPVYQMLKRVFSEHFRVEERVLKIKVDKELSASSLQSPDDLEATYREKGKKSYKGYVANLTETCDPENNLQLITKVQVEANNAEDADLLVEALPNLKERTGVETIYTDGGYGSPEADEILQSNHVEQIQSAIRGRVPSAEKLNLADFEIKQTESGTPTQIICPQQQTVAVQPSSQNKGYVAHFDTEICRACPFNETGVCPVQCGRRDSRYYLRFSRQQANMSQRRRRSLRHQKEGRNLRAAIEATVREVKHPFPASKLPVRGLVRITCMVIGSALVSNARRIQRYLEAMRKLENEQLNALKGEECSREQSLVSFFASINAILCGWMTPITFQPIRFGY
jgi:hypothetical protein